MREYELVQVYGEHAGYGEVVGHEPNPDGRIVTLVTVSQADAQMVRSLLTDNGIPSVVGGGDGDGWYPNLAYADGCPIQVFEKDLPAARTLIEAAPEMADVAESPEVPAED
ncbi:MAG: DUF2007 domain-containing protein [Acidimicrobiia bacterium]|nr:DUF2007 domain-containing protein [Acidimicrobiia bacterium]